jgi:hypothetical protein
MTTACRIKIWWTSQCGTTPCLSQVVVSARESPEASLLRVFWRSYDPQERDPVKRIEKKKKKKEERA